MRFAYPAVKQPQGSVHIADGSYGGAGISAQAGLVNHNGGRQVFDFVCPWLFELGQPAPDKGRIGFIHLALAFRSNSVKYNAGFSRTGHPCKDYDFSFRDFKGNIFQVVLAQPLYHNAVLMRHIIDPSFFWFSHLSITNSKKSLSTFFAVANALIVIERYPITQTLRYQIHNCR